MEKQKKFKYIKGSYGVGEPAHIYFFTDVDYWSADDFMYEFKYLQKYVEPSEINVHINSGGGNCIDGISIFSMIQNCSIPTKTINEGIAASMASVIWSAGDELYMRDYAILMIHNPFVDGNVNDPKTKQVVEAFKKQLSIIYQKRFGLDEETIKGIMDGKEGEDGTFMTAAEAIEMGFVQEENVIETPKAVKDLIAATFKRVGNPVLAGAKINDIIEKQNGLAHKANKINTINNSTIQKEKSDMNEEIKILAAILGLTGESATLEKVSANVKDLIDIKSKFDAVSKNLENANSENASLKTKLAGSEASVKNLTQSLNDANASLKAYREAEENARNLEIEGLVDDAIKACKINKDARESWIEMAKSNLDLTRQTLDSIPARDNISNAIASDESNRKNSDKTPESPLEKEINAKVNSVVGEDFSFLKPSF